MYLAGLITVATSLLPSMGGRDAHANPVVDRIDRIADRLLRANGRSLRGHIIINEILSGGWASISSPDWNGSVTVYIHPQHAYDSDNQMGFVLGHELAHQLHAIGTGPANEMEADVLGAEMAAKAGWNIKAYADEILQRPNQCDPLHGCLHDRVRHALRMVRSGPKTSAPLRCFQGCSEPIASPPATVAPASPWFPPQAQVTPWPRGNPQWALLMNQMVRDLEWQLQQDSLLFLPSLYGGY
jgi:hypothetical protein